MFFIKTAGYFFFKLRGKRGMFFIGRGFGGILAGYFNC